MLRLFENKDCMDGMKEYSDNFFDLAIVDPPYGINIAKTGYVGGGHKNIGAKYYGAKTWDNESPKREYFQELMRVSKNQIIFGANHFISKMPYDSSCWFVWDKNNTGNFAECELAWTSFKMSIKKIKYTWNGMLQENMKSKEYRIHPTQKPIALYKWILKKFAEDGFKLLDTHVGSGSSLIAFEEFGYEYVGYEIDKEYYENAKERLVKWRSQLKLFE